MPVHTDLSLARACLQRLHRILPGGALGLIEQHGAIEALRRLRAAHRNSTGCGVECGTVEACLERAAADLDTAHRLGITLLVPEHAGWPRRLGGHRLTQPIRPIALWVRGDSDLDTRSRRAVTILAGPQCGAYGVEVADLLGYALAQHSATLVSDTGRGVAAAVQRSAIRAGSGSANLVVLPCGPEHIYPADAMDIIEPVADHGAIVSMCPPGTPPHPSLSVEAAQLAASLSGVTVVVQADLDSPLLDLARTLAAHTRLLAVPGPITARGCAGPHHLLRNHLAHPATSAADITDAFTRDPCQT